MGRGAIKTPDFMNHPTRGRVIRDEALFFEHTQRNDIKLQSQTIPGSVVGETMMFDLPHRGIASELRLHFDLSIVVSSYQTGLSKRDKFPYNLVKRLRVIANGSDIVNCSGLDLYLLAKMDAESPDYSDVEVDQLTNADGTYSVDFVLPVPLAIDRTTLMGAVFAETDSTYLKVEIQFESQAELVNAQGTTALAWSGTVKPELTTWDVPPYNTSQGLAFIVPDLSILAMIGVRDYPITSAAEHAVDIMPTQGQLIRTWFSLYDASAYDYVNPLTWNGVGLRYGQNQELRRMSTRDLMFQNARWFGDILPKQHLAFDLVAENSLRDVLVPNDVNDPEVIVDATGLTIAAGDYIHLAQQIAVASPTWAQATPVA